MSWTWHLASGCIADGNGRIQGCGYAGKGEGKNNPVLQDVHGGCRWQNGLWVPVGGLTDQDWGPLPCGLYVMNPPLDTEKHGPYVMWLSAAEDNEMYGRSGFGVHGDSLEHPGEASDGCICLGKPIRMAMWNSGDHQLQVIA